MARRGRRTGGWVKKDDRLFTLAVFVIGGPVEEKFAKENPVISRTIQLRGDQTLEALHYAIFDALDREEEHMYQFEIGGKRPMDPKARRYDPPEAMEDMFTGEKTGGDATRTTIGSLGLKLDETFAYWFDFGDDWWHQINVVAIEDQAPPGDYPKITARVGKSPPQYPDLDEEDEEAAEDDEDQE